jgi:hypothetical protein
MGAEQIKVLKRQLGEELIAKFGLVGEVRHGLPFSGQEHRYVSLSRLRPELQQAMGHTTPQFPDEIAHW